MPPVVTGYVLLLLFGRKGPLGQLLADSLGIVLGFRWTGAALACAVMGFPLMVRSMRLSIEAVDRRLEDAAGTLGANAFWVFATITLPLILPTAIYMLIQVPGGDLAAFRLTLVSIAISLAALLVSEVLIERATRRAQGL